METFEKTQHILWTLSAFLTADYEVLIYIVPTYSGCF